MENELQRLREIVRQDYMEAMKNPHHISWCLRLTRTEEELGSLFLRAYRREITIDELNEKFGLFTECLAEYDESDYLIDDCNGFLNYDFMHDPPIDWEGLLRYGRTLLGELEIKYYPGGSDGIGLQVTYLKRK